MNEINPIFYQDIEDCEEAYFNGEKLMLFEAIRRCGQYGIPLPEWVQQAIDIGLEKWQLGVCEEFGECFDIESRTPKKMRAIQTRVIKGFFIYDYVKRRLGKGKTSEALIEEASQQLNPLAENVYDIKDKVIGTALAKELYYEVKGAIKKS